MSIKSRWTKLQTLSLGSGNELRGDTFIEVMFAIATFALVAALSISMMNAGVATSERSLEVVTARNEIDAQAEALRFIHTSYVAELSLPDCSAVTTECRRPFTEIWKEIENRSGTPVDNINNCEELYESGSTKLNGAFVINTRQMETLNNSLLNAVSTSSAKDLVIKHTASDTIFRPAVLNARLLYTKRVLAANEENPDDSSANDLDAAVSGPEAYTILSRAEGMWIIRKPDTDSAHRYDDFYIQSCWYSPGSLHPTSIETIVRLYSAKGKH